MLSSTCVAVLVRCGCEIMGTNETVTLLACGERLVSVPRGALLDEATVRALCAKAGIALRTFAGAAAALRVGRRGMVSRAT